MPDFADQADELAGIHAAFAVPVQYTGAGLDDEEVLAIESEVEGDPFTGAGKTLRRLSFEIQMSALPGRPAKGNLIIPADATRWEVIEVTERRDVSAWALTVELAP